MAHSVFSELFCHKFSVIFLTTLLTIKLTVVSAGVFLITHVDVVLIATVADFLA